MTGRERIAKALNHEEADRIPYDLAATTVTSITKNAYQGAMNARGMSTEFEKQEVDPISQIITPIEKNLVALGSDTRRIGSMRIPEYHTRKRLEQYFIQILSRIVELQGADGYWRSSLLDPESYPSKETSATGFYTYALWWGINKGLLDRDSYLEPATRAWEALVKAVQPSGMLGYVQAIGDTPQNVSADSNDVYGTAAFMLAGLEVSKYLLEK